MAVLDKKIKKNALNFPVVGIGASTAGIDVLKKILSEISEDSGMAYIIAQHFSSHISSSLPEILSDYTTIPVIEIINDVNLEPNHIYIIPENNVLTTVDGILMLKRNIRSERLHNNIDVFFESLAEVHKRFIIGILLFSDIAFDGALGFKKIKESGGITIVQDPKTAVFKGISQRFVENYFADYVLAPENIPSHLLEIQKKDITNYTCSDEENIPQNEEEILAKIIDFIFLRTGNDFHGYKHPTIRRRIAIRMVIRQKETLENYYNLLQIDKKEQEILFNDFLISVTYFFRDKKSFENLTKIVFPLLVKNTIDDTLRIWVAGCATGEEAYSLAICLHEYLLQTNNEGIKVQIFASDLSEKCITKARSAVYSDLDIQQISDERLQNYFVKNNGEYHVKKVIRDMCVFAVHNFVKDTPFARMDLVSCRNVLIYFNSTLQSKALASFHYSLKDKGMLFLGKLESVTNAPDLFENIGKQEKFYVRKIVPNKNVPETFRPAQKNFLEKIKTSKLKTIPEIDFRKIVSDILFSKFTPVSVIINEHLEIVHFHGDTSPFLSPSPGKPSFNILKMVNEGISSELQNAILKAKSEKINIRKDNIPIKKHSYLVSFEILSLQNDEEHLMVLFYKEGTEKEPEKKVIQNNQDQKRIEELEHQLSKEREAIKQMIAEQQTTFEELHAINKELEIATQEFESNKEELKCVHNELENNQRQLINIHDYAESIIKTIHEPLLIIDKHFTIKSANPAFYKLFKTTDIETEGRIFFEIGNSQWDILEFKNQITKVINNQEIIENFKVELICAGNGKKTMMVNARPLQNSIEGLILIALNDSTDLLNANELLTVKNSEIQKYNNQLEKFTTAASNDLQEPLRKIHMFSKRIFDNEKNMSESGRHDLERVQYLIVNLSQLINDVIDYSKVIFLEKKYIKTDLNSLLKKNIKDLKDVIIKKNAVVSVMSFPELNVIPNQIQQLFTNLITNSIKYSKEDVVPEIQIETQQPSSEEIIEIGGNPEIDYVKICVIDNGIGFDKGHESKIFEPFYRLHTNSYQKGSGLGLTLVKKIVANHRGFIKVISEINLGTTMVIYIPV
ncbi:CheR family methyltransferase [Flavobacterium sp. FZUC8N2.13]|uniref:CheR family methyltransferase n=1 Tax=Flavobacterium zubiriense TaxID=3138075 RepID=A0ABV4TCD1_9FLAO